MSTASAQSGGSNDDALIQSLWIGPRLDAMAAMCLRSFVCHQHRVRLFTYAEVANVPEGVELADASEILPWSDAFRTTCDSYANFADLFRYQLLIQRGGWWVDCDVLCLRPWRDLPDTVVSSTDELGYGRTGNVYVLRSPPGGVLMQACYEEAVKLGEARLTFAATGPFLVSRVIRDLGVESLMVSPDVFAPVPWNSVRYFVTSRPFARHLFHLKNAVRRRHLLPHFTRRTVGVHLWSGMWNSGGVDRNATYPWTSLYSTYRRRYGGASRSRNTAVANGTTQ